MKKYIKSTNYINLDDNIDELIEEFDPYIDDVYSEIDDDGSEWLSVLVKDHNSDFSEWIDVRIDPDGEIDFWEWNRQIFFDRTYTHDMNIKRVLDSDAIYDKVDYILSRYVETGVIDE